MVTNLIIPANAIGLAAILTFMFVFICVGISAYRKGKLIFDNELQLFGILIVVSAILCDFVAISLFYGWIAITVVGT